ncbi:MAG TPA: hypothetical protein DEH78_33340 [Solibacterales bacterium]|nr:hypothetical protein [Bryobacterales bacterium]
MSLRRTATQPQLGVLPLVVAGGAAAGGGWYLWDLWQRNQQYESWKARQPAPPPAAPPGAPQTREEMTSGRWTGEDAARRGMENTRRRIQSFFAQLPVEPDRASNVTDAPWFGLALGAAAVLLIVVLVRR